MDGFLSAYQALQPGARLDSFEDFLQVTFGWEDADAGSNTQVMFPGLAGATACSGQSGTATAAAVPPPRDAAPADDLLACIAGDLCAAGQQQQPAYGQSDMGGNSSLSSAFAAVDSLVVHQCPQQQSQLRTQQQPQPCTQQQPQPCTQQQPQQLVPPPPPEKLGRVSPFAQPAPLHHHSHAQLLALPGTDEVITAHIYSMQQQLQQQQQQQTWQNMQQRPPARSKHVTTASRGRRQRPEAAKEAERQATEQAEETPSGAAVHKRRGRPVKVPGQYSRGYTAILRYRNKKKQWVAQMEADIAAKRELLVQLKEQQRALRHKHDALEAAIGTQDEMLSQLHSVHLSIGPASGTVAVAESLVTAAAATAQQRQLPHVPGGRPAGGVARSSSLSGAATDANGGAAAAAAVHGTRDWAGIIPQLDAKLQQQHQEREQQQQQQQQQPQTGSSTCSSRLASTSTTSPNSSSGAADPLLLWGKFRDYIVHVAAQLARERQADSPAAAGAGARTASCDAAPGAAAPRSLPGTDTVDATGYPPLPFTLGQALALWTLNRRVGTAMPQPGAPAAATTAAAAEPGDAEQAGHRLLNLRTREYDLVVPAFWARVAGQIQLTPGQRPQLEAAWRLFTSSITRLNRERQALLCKLRDAHGGDAASHVWVGAGGRRVVLPGRHARDLDSYASLADEVEANLMRGRLLVMLYTWSMFCVLDNKQGAQLCVGSWPYFPVTRAIMGNLLGMPELQEGA